jgi:hypothetical protein
LAEANLITDPIAREAARVLAAVVAAEAVVTAAKAAVYGHGMVIHTAGITILPDVCDVPSGEL